MNSSNKWIIAVSVVLPTLLEVIDTSVVNVSLNNIRGSLSASIDEATWTITAYLVSNAIIIPLTGWLSRIFGRKRYLLFSVAIFTFSSFMCGTSRSLRSLVFFRVVQGMGGGALHPLSQAILLEAFPPAEYGMAMAMFGIGVMVGPIFGPVLGGWITDNWSWPWIFYINIPVGILSTIMIMAFIYDPPYLKREKIKIDYWGLGCIAVGLGCLQVVLDKGQREDWFASDFIKLFAIVSATALILLVIMELRTPNPVVNLRVFKDVCFASGNIIMFTAFFVLFASIVLLPLFLQQLMGYTSFWAGLALAPGGVATLIMMPIVGRLVMKINPKWILACGLLITSLSVFMMVHFNFYIDFYTAALPRVVMGFGLGMLFVPLTSMTFATIKKEAMGNATGIFNLLRNLGGSCGVAFITTLLTRRTQFHQFRLSEHLNPLDIRYQIGFDKAMEILKMRIGAATDLTAKGVIYQKLLREASLLAYNDAFYIASFIMLCIVPFAFLLRQPKYAQGEMIK
jgi:DHA2 family multidrug resistance protein